VDGENSHTWRRRRDVRQLERPFVVDRALRVRCLRLGRAVRRVLCGRS
jgi:hypothetical protein